MDGFIFIVFAFFAVGMLVGGIARSWWALAYPGLVFAVLAIGLAIGGGANERLTRTGAALLGVVWWGGPAVLGTLIGVGAGKAFAGRN